MKFLDNLKLRRKFIFVFSLIIFMVEVGFIYVTFQKNRIGDQVDLIYKVHLMGMEYLIEADRDAYQSSLALGNCLRSSVASDAEKLKSNLEAVDENYAQVNQRYTKFENLSEITSQAEYKELNSGFHSNYDKLGELTNKIKDLIKNQNLSDAEIIYNGEYEDVFQTMRSVMDQFTEVSINNADVAYENSRKINKTITFNLIIFSVIILLMLILVGVTITKSIKTPLSRAMQSLINISKGDLTIRFEEEDLKRKDEIGIFMQSMQGMLNNLHDIVTKILINADNINSASSELTNTSQQLSEGANQQASSVEEVSSTMEEMSSNIQQNSENSIQTGKIALESAQGIEKVNDASRKSLESISNISGKITIINDIAFQTNILALNAAVEAARAGEHGKGFAVVAAEVRKLAERSKIAADEIVGLSTQSVSFTKETVALLEKILPEIQKTNQLVHEITSASMEQNNGANQVNNALQQLNNVTQMNASASEELATSAEELNAQAQSLMDIISFFKIKNGM